MSRVSVVMLMCRGSRRVVWFHCTSDHNNARGKDCARSLTGYVPRAVLVKGQLSRTSQTVILVILKQKRRTSGMRSILDKKKTTGTKPYQPPFKITIFWEQYLVTFKRTLTYCFIWFAPHHQPSKKDLSILLGTIHPVMNTRRVRCV